MPRPLGRQSPSPQATSKSAPSSTRNSASNLLALDSNHPPSSSQAPHPASSSKPQPLLDLLTGGAESTTSSASSTSNPSFSASSDFINQLSDPFSSSTKASTAASAPVLAPHSVFGASPGQQQQQQQPGNTKENIMSLYTQNQPQLPAYTAQGVPVNVYYYQQQQAAAMQMAQMAALQQQQQFQQVNQVTAQMQKIKMNQGTSTMPSQPFPVGNGSHSASGAAGVGVANGGQTLNPTLW